MARAFLDAGSAAYIAPDGYPQGALLFLHRLYHELAVGAALSAAADAVSGQDARDDDAGTASGPVSNRRSAIMGPWSNRVRRRNRCCSRR